MRDRGATRALVLGLLGMWFGVFAPFAIFAGARSLRRIRASHGELRVATVDEQADGSRLITAAPSGGSFAVAVAPAPLRLAGCA